MAMEPEHAYGGAVWVPERHASVKPTQGLDECVGPLRRERAPCSLLFILHGAMGGGPGRSGLRRSASIVNTVASPASDRLC